MNRTERRRAAPLTGRAEEQSRARRRGIIIYSALGALAVAAILAVGIYSNKVVPKSASDAPTFAKIAVGEQGAQFAVSTTGGPFDLNAARGKPTLLELFATWCPHCQRETSVLNALYTKYKTNANILAVSASPYGLDSTSPESQADVLLFANQYKVTYPIAYDGDLDVAKKYLQGGFPTMVLMDKNGKILAYGSGEIAGPALDKAMANALAGKPVDPNFGPKK